MIRLFTLLILVGTLFPNFAMGSEVLTLNGDRENFPFLDSIVFLEDNERSLTIDDVSSPAFADRFEPLKEIDKAPTTIQFSSSDSVWWLRLKVRAEDVNAMSKDWIIDLANPMFIGKIDLYSPIATIANTASKEGWHKQSLNTDKNRLFKQERFLKLPAPKRTSKTLFLRIESDHYIILRAAICTASHRESEITKEALLEGFFFSVVIVIGIFNLFAFLWLKNRTSLWQLMFGVSVGYYLLVGSNSYFDFRTAKLLGPMSFVYLQSLGLGGIMATCVMFTRSFLRTKEHTPKLHKFLTAYLGLTLIGILILPLMELNYDTGFFCAQVVISFSPLVIPFATIIPGIVRLRQGFKPAKVYLIAWGIFAVCAFLFALPFNIQNGFLILKIGCCECIAMLAFATVRRHRALVLEKDILSAAKENAEAALGQSEERFRTLANSTTAQIAIVQDNQLVWANEAFVQDSNSTLDYLKNAPLIGIFSQHTLDISRKARLAAENQNKTTFRYETMDRGDRWFEVSTSLVEVDGSDAFISTSFDITESKRAQGQMFRAQKMASLGQIIAGVAHEINNPNNFIYFNLPILKKYVDSIRPVLDEVAANDENLKILNMPYDMFIEDIYKLLDNMQHGSKRITDIVSDLKNYVRVSDKEDKVPTSIDDVISQVMTLVGKQVRKQVKTFEIDVQDDLPMVNMNAGKIEQVLINLVINAGQAANKDDAWVKLRAQSESNDWIKITVEDNGSGIKDENLHNIFEPFFTTKQEESGTGLGLAISYKIIEDHGGEIDVTSTVGEGTTFTIQLPAHQLS